MKLSALLAGVAGAEVVGPDDVDVGEVRDDSRLVAPGDLFVAVQGTAADGHAFLADAIARDARVLVVEAKSSDKSSDGGGPQRPSTGLPPELAAFRGTRVTVPRARQALGLIAANRFGAANVLSLMAVTGTNGKTTTTYLIEAMLQAAGKRVGVIGTVSYRVGGAAPAPGAPRAAPPAGFSHAAPLTTPGALALQGLLAEMRAAGASDVVLEATSHALDQGRLEGCRFRVAGLTNLTQDHLDYHGTMDAYLDAKAILFERLLDPRIGVAVLPVDRAEGRALRARTRGHAVLGVAAQPTPGADVVVERVDASGAGMRLRLGTPLGPLELASPLVGTFNLENILLAVGMAIGRGLDAGAITAGITGLAGVPGRLERVANDRGVLCVVDYAHTPDGLERALAAVRPLVAPGGRLVTVFGCGGDRDRTKRPIMGEIATRDSELAIVTSDNPRTEDPGSIIAMIVEGTRRTGAVELAPAALATGAARGFSVVPDRRAAIRCAVAAIRAGDVLLIAGKGHEDYQIIGHERLHLDDREEAGAAFATLGPPAPETVPAPGGPWT